MGLKARKVPGSCPSHLSVLHSAPAEGEASGNPCLVYAIDLQTFTKPPRWIIHPDCCSLSRLQPYLKWRTVTAYLTLLLQETEMAGFSGTFHHTGNSAAACHEGHKRSNPGLLCTSVPINSYPPRRKSVLTLHSVSTSPRNTFPPSEATTSPYLRQVTCNRLRHCLSFIP